MSADSTRQHGSKERSLKRGRHPPLRHQATVLKSILRNRVWNGNVMLSMTLLVVWRIAISLIQKKIQKISFVLLDI